MDLVLIAAIAKNRVIGKDGKIPWMGQFPEDLKRFKNFTRGHPIIMGRVTYESLPSRPLPDRTNIVLTGSRIDKPKKVIVAYNLEEALSQAEKAEGSDEVFVIGGQRVYERTLGKANRMELTWINAEYDGDRHFPNFDERDWEVTKKVDGENCSFVSYRRI